MKIFLYISLSFFLLSGFLNPLFAQEPEINAGLVSGLWFSESEFFAGDKIRVYGAFQNQSGFDIEGKVVLISNDGEVGESNFSVLDERLIEVWVDWVVPEGDQEITLQIKELLKSTPEGTESIEVKTKVLAEEKFFVDVDTDNDNIGNQIDIDDDNDGLTDEEESLVGTEPLVSDTDNDGILDGEDPEPLVAVAEEMFIEQSIDSKQETSTLENIAKKTKNTAISTDNLVQDLSNFLVKKVESVQEKRGQESRVERTVLDKFIGQVLFALFVVFSSRFLPYVLFFVIAFAVIKILFYLITIILGKDDK